MASDESGAKQQYAIQARKNIAALRQARPGITKKSAGVPPTNVSPATKKPTNGPRLRQRSHKPTCQNKVASGDEEASGHD